MLEFNDQHQIHFFPIHSGRSPFPPDADLDWVEKYESSLKDLGERIREQDNQITMHPGQFPGVNGTDSDVVVRVVQNLQYDATVLDVLGLSSNPKIILHIGGIYGNQSQARKHSIKHAQDRPTTSNNTL